ncbi:MAG: Glu-tRNA(Gln) amidotransferase subunit GatE [Candidatus Kapaibacterium sp.]
MIDFVFKPFNEMTDKDYKLIGFKSGLEIHQQLFTEKKLFCRCPAGKYNQKFDAEILRHMRPTLSELGEYDGTALMEFKTKKDIIYHINRETVCTYEMDDTPPFEINEQALDIALEIALLYKSATTDEIHIARKQYLDGSIPTGFQRTAIISIGGSIPYKNRRINIIQLSIEEDSCREVSDFGHRRVYIADRLGMPLVETVTAPDMKTPVEVAEVGKILSNIVKSTGKVRTGAGAAREDVNVSVTGGTRIEIKGVPSLYRIPLLTYNEAMRQWNLLRLKEELKNRNITAETFSSRHDHITRLLRKTKYLPISNALNEELIIGSVILRGFKGLLNWQTQTETYFSKEISDRVRVVACLTTLPNIIHSDSTSETISIAEWQKVKKAIGAVENDTVVIVWGSEMDVDTAMKEITIRAKEATIGIPSETRQALKDGTTGFERILPGPERMYPDTDLPPKRIKSDRIKEIQLQVPGFYCDRVVWYKKLGVPEDLIEPLAISKLANLFEEVVSKWKLDPKLAAVVLIQYPKRLKKMGLKFENVDSNLINDILKAYKDGLLAKEGILPALYESVKSGIFDAKNLPSQIKPKEMKEVIANCVIDMNRKKIHNNDKRGIVLKGIVMDNVRGKIDGKKATDSVMKYLKENK